MNFRVVLGFILALIVFIIVLVVIAPFLLSLAGNPSPNDMNFLIIRALILLISVTAASLVYYLIKE